MSNLILLGAGGHAQSVIDVVESQGRYTIIGLIAPDPHGEFLYKILGNDEIIENMLKLHYSTFHIAIGSVPHPDIRIRVYQKFEGQEIDWATVVSPFSYIAPSAKIQAGVFIGHNVMIGPNVLIHAHAIINSGAVIEHGAEIGSFTHVAPNATILGETTIGSGSFIGAGSVVRGAFLRESIIPAAVFMKGGV